MHFQLSLLVLKILVFNFLFRHAWIILKIMKATQKISIEFSFMYGKYWLGFWNYATGIIKLTFTIKYILCTNIDCMYDCIKNSDEF